MFILGLRFWTAPVYLKYNSKANATSAPLAIPVVFFGYHSDIKLMGALVFAMNFYVFWYHVDPVYDEYSHASLQRKNLANKKR